ncbi:auxin-responsive protein SAUR71 [Vigna radiata var. radiata]|uniref:Auxin-responsive protein SAUR71 n=1 Tax=Vigna radiata var. radiata TaxID=3916 RepID=A0A1S3U400_VIGRR|nr:auxin-responsive protein SAUR71 [Vigna radiata var. radiata]
MSMDPTKKPNKIRDIVRLQQILKKWRRAANSSKTSRSNSNNTNNSTGRSIKFLKRTLSISEGGGSSSVVPKGYVAVCVGVDLSRFVIPTEYLGHQAFHMLLREAEEEFGFEQTGVLRIPCEVSVFESILKIVERKDKFFTQKCRFSIEKMMGYCSSNNLAYSHHPQSPMCR